MVHLFLEYYSSGLVTLWPYFPSQWTSIWIERHFSIFGVLFMNSILYSLSIHCSNLDSEMLTLFV